MKLVVPARHPKHFWPPYPIPIVLDVGFSYRVEINATIEYDVVDDDGTGMPSFGIRADYYREEVLMFTIQLDNVTAALLAAALRLLEPDAIEAVDDAIARQADVLEPAAKRWLALAPVFEPARQAGAEVCEHAYGVGHIAVQTRGGYVEMPDAYIVYPLDVEVRGRYRSAVAIGAQVVLLKRETACRLAGNAGRPPPAEEAERFHKALDIFLDLLESQ